MYDNKQFYIYIYIYILKFLLNIKIFIKIKNLLNIYFIKMKNLPQNFSEEDPGLL